jgi:homoserine dehydrogenase
MPRYRLVLIGFGNVGQALAELLIRKRQELQQSYDIDWSVVGIATGSHGLAVDPQGLDLSQALAAVRSGQNLSQLSTTPSPADAIALIQEIDAEVLFENSPVNYETGQPAISHLEAALENGMHAITANKGPVVHGHRHLTDLAEAQGRCFFFESTVMDGAPIFGMWREALPAARPKAFRGLLNSTTNLILTLMEQGQSYQQAVAYAQQIGIAETDPSGDTQGWDAAVKVAALATVLMDQPLKPQQVEREGIEGITAEMVERSRAAGKRWKLVCEARRDGRQIMARVQPQELDSADPLYNVMGTSSAVSFASDVLGELTLVEKDPSPHTTAYGLLADFVNAVMFRD